MQEIFRIIGILFDGFFDVLWEYLPELLPYLFPVLMLDELLGDRSPGNIIFNKITEWYQENVGVVADALIKLAIGLLVTGLFILILYLMFKYSYRAQLRINLIINDTAEYKGKNGRRTVSRLNGILFVLSLIFMAMGCSAFGMDEALTSEEQITAFCSMMILAVTMCGIGVGPILTCKEFTWHDRLICIGRIFNIGMIELLIAATLVIFVGVGVVMFFLRAFGESEEKQEN